MLPKTASYSFSPACLFICLLPRLLRRLGGRNRKALRYTLPVKDCRRWQIWSERCRNQDLERHGWRAGIRGKVQKQVPPSIANLQWELMNHQIFTPYGTIWNQAILCYQSWHEKDLSWSGCVCVGGLFVHQPPIKVCLGQLFFLLLVLNN